MNITNWDADCWEISVSGKTFFVSAVFDWERSSVDYSFDPRRGYSGQGRDLVAEIPCDVLAVEIFPENDADTVEISLVNEIRNKILDLFKNSEAGTKNASWEKWM